MVGQALKALDALPSNVATGVRRSVAEMSGRRDLVSDGFFAFCTCCWGRTAQAKQALPCQVAALFPHRHTGSVKIFYTVFPDHEGESIGLVSWIQDCRVALAVCICFVMCDSNMHRAPSTGASSTLNAQPPNPQTPNPQPPTPNPQPPNPRP
jgi:hypothetical protein